VGSAKTPTAQNGAGDFPTAEERGHIRNWDLRGAPTRAPNGSGVEAEWCKGLGSGPRSESQPLDKRLRLPSNGDALHAKRSFRSVDNALADIDARESES
jgi:hypothetical protein